MKYLIVLSALFACAVASGYDHAPVHVAVPAKPIYAPAYIPTTVKLGESHYSYPVLESKFTRTDYETPGATYPIPATKTYTITRPGFTTYLKSAITKQHVTTHQVAGPTIVKPVVAPVVTKALAPVEVHAAVHAPVHAAVHAPVHAAPLHGDSYEPVHGEGYAPGYGSHYY